MGAVSSLTRTRLIRTIFGFLLSVFSIQITSVNTNTYHSNIDNTVKPLESGPLESGNLWNRGTSEIGALEFRGNISHTNEPLESGK